MVDRRTLFLGGLILFNWSCASGPRLATEPLVQKEARQWLQKYCTAPQSAGLAGEMVVRSNARELKGQFPASVRFEPQGDFLLEVTHILGGTVAQLQGNAQTLSVRVSGKPKLNRDHVTHYLGLEVPVLVSLLRGTLPCPREWEQVEVQSGVMVVKGQPWEWRFYRSTSESGSVPVKIELFANGLTLHLKIEDWNLEENYLKKGQIRSPEGDLKWSWRSRNLIKGPQ